MMPDQTVHASAIETGKDGAKRLPTGFAVTISMPSTRQATTVTKKEKQQWPDT